MAVDYFLKIDGIEGESSDETHSKEIELISYDWAQAQSGKFAQGGGGGAGKVQMDNFRFVTATNKSSPKLMLACATGQHIGEAVLTCRKAGGGQQEFYKVTMKDVLVSTYRTRSHAGGLNSTDDGGYNDGRPTDEFSLNFAKIEFEYRPQKEDGSLDNPVKTGYDLKLNKKV